MEDQVTAWIKTGLKIFAEEGEITVNTLCKKHGKSRSSFYNMYPNVEKSMGFDRYMDDLRQHHERMIFVFCEQLRNIYVKNDIHNAIKKLVNLCYKTSIYHRCSAQIRKNATRNATIQKHWQIIKTAYIEVIDAFNKTFTIPYSKAISYQKMRLLLDSFSHYKGETYIKDFTEIIYMWIHKDQPKQIKST